MDFKILKGDILDARKIGKPFFFYFEVKNGKTDIQE